MQQLRIEFERIGRRRGVDDLVVRVSDLPEAAELELESAIRRYARKFLASKEFDVTVDWPALDSGRIEYGRFGTFNIRPEV